MVSTEETEKITKCMEELLENGCLHISCERCPLYTKKGGENTSKTDDMRKLCEVLQSLT